MITVKTMTESQDAAIMAGAKSVKVTIRYEERGGVYGRSPRKETVKTTLPSWDGDHPTIVGKDAYFIAPDGLIYEAVSTIRDGETYAFFHLGWRDKREVVREHYDENYSHSVIINGFVSRPAPTLYAVMSGGMVEITKRIPEHYDIKQMKNVSGPRVGEWYVPLAHLDLFRTVWREYMRNDDGINVPLHEDFKIPDDERVRAALEANAQSARWGVDVGVYAPSVGEMLAASVLVETVRETRNQRYSDPVSMGWAGRIADAYARIVEAQKDAVVLR